MEAMKEMYFAEANKYASLCAEYDGIDDELSADYELHFLMVFEIIKKFGWGAEYMGI